MPVSVHTDTTRQRVERLQPGLWDVTVAGDYLGTVRKAAKGPTFYVVPVGFSRSPLPCEGSLSAAVSALRAYFEGI